MYILKFGKGGGVKASAKMELSVHAATKASLEALRFLDFFNLRLNYINNYLRRLNITEKFSKRKLGDIVKESYGKSQLEFLNLVKERISKLLQETNTGKTSGVFDRVKLASNKFLSGKKAMWGATALGAAAGISTLFNGQDSPNLSMNANNEELNMDAQFSSDNDGGYDNEYDLSGSSYDGGESYLLNDPNNYLQLQGNNIGNEWFGSNPTTNNTNYAKLLYSSIPSNNNTSSYFTYTKDNSILNNLSYYHGLYK